MSTPQKPVESSHPVVTQRSLVELVHEAQRLQSSGDLDGAVQAYRDWIEAGPAPMAHVACFNLGTLLGAQQRHAEAEQAYRQAVALQPDFPHARLNLGHLLERRGQHDEALAEWQQVLDGTAQPELRVHALNNRGRLLEQLRRYPDAEAELKRSLELNPEQPNVVQHYVHLRQKQCEWPAWQPVGEVTHNRLLMGTSLLAMMGLSDDPAMQLLAAVRFANERVPKAQPVPLHSLQPPRTGKIRIGYLSGDLHMHAVGLLTPELFELHDRSRVETWAFCWTPESAMPQRQRILRAMDHVVRIDAVDDAAAARLIAEAGIDVLVDLQGLTNGARPAILGYRAAPIQVSYLGLPGTSGLPGVDWILADHFVMPPELEPYCTEKPIRLPHCYQVSDRQREVGRTPTRAELGLPPGKFVYCSFNNNHKFTENVFASWMRILAGVPDSVLWLLADNDTAQENMLRCADAHGVARERILFAPRAAPPDYLARFRCADLMLDTFPYNAGTTASDALWMGLPIVTWSGRSYISRMAGSLLHAVGLPDLVTDSLAEYEKLAVRIGREPARAASYRRYLDEHGRSSPLFDMPRLVRDIENEFERLALAHRL
ncbi:O-linked N-acetylglucosamine transferase, SPINDLY family protein [Aquabacterium sp. OR-4]|uniref:O-linked N-acetylglucosamine transferase, SPINDLY family protein n=1 Tax=Aquabacterium sp. OR-4 TaxID=2978127 RepID=UPI0021B19A09|nr:tetratricopeptide repeat protein [Aquabacterium sp. OR-4]MDT7836555.1 tetratricopeptide repeat protein [Aquabacterium sp. OR-4]